MPKIKKVSVILDTDIETDCDDVGAIAALHSLADRGEADILGMICSSPLQWGAPCLQVLNTFYHRPDIPIGTFVAENMQEQYARYLQEVEELTPERLYNRHIAEHYPSARDKDAYYPESTSVYRKLLSEQPDRSVVICAIGFLGPLAQLLQSQPDDNSALSGMELVKTKVRLLVSMAIGTFPIGKDRFNWLMDPLSAAYVLNHWPVAIAVSEHGEHIRTGAGLRSALPEPHPVRVAYERYLQGAERSRASWDQVAVLYAVRGTADLFAERAGYRINYDQHTHRHCWSRSGYRDNRDDRYVWPILPPEEMALLIENLMIDAKGR